MSQQPTTDLNGLFEDRRKTQPWLPEEFIRVSGYCLVYTVAHRAGTMLVRLPGGRAASVEQLQAEGHVVTLPKRVRK